MRCKSILEAGLSLFVTLVVVGSSGLAQTAAAPTANAQLVQALKTAHKLLATADRDYDGHRALAAQEVRKAMAALGYHRRKKAGGLDVQSRNCRCCPFRSAGDARPRRTRTQS